jgi:hypothetical protein
MKKILFPLLLFLMVALASCYEREYEVDFGSVEPGYPSTYFRLGNSVLNQYKNEYQLANHPGLYTSIDSFGFINASVRIEKNISEFRFGPVSQSKAKSIAKKFLLNNSKFTGVTDTILLNFNIVTGMQRHQRPDFCQWNIIVGTQIYNELEVENTRIYLLLDSLGVYRAHGNWYPEIKIPERDNLSYEMAKTQIIGLKLSTGSWSGPIEQTISSSTKYQEPTVRKVIYPLKLNDHIELRVAWQLYPAIWKVLVDTSTGEIIHTEPTMIF